MATMSVVEQALIITVIGVVSIFAVLFILWGLMAALVRVTAARAAPQVATASPSDARAAQAAAVAVAVALALQAENESAPPSMPVTQGPISPWQATLRGNAMSRRAGVYRRN